MPQPRPDPQIYRLSYWLERLDRAAMPMIPANQIATMRASLLFAACDGELTKPDELTLAAIEKVMVSASERGDVVRYDCCAGSELKHFMAQGNDGKRPPKECSWPFPDDPRLIDIVMDVYEPDEDIKIFARPWITAQVVDRYPVEFRAFVQHGQVIGVSNYYPQRPLPATFEEHARSVCDFTEMLIENANESFTLDWLMVPAQGIVGKSISHCSQNSSRGVLVVLEGGPPHELHGGAHPCCFKPGQIDGIALADRNPVE